MTTGREQEIDWLHWLRRWDEQQEGYVREREARFAAMLDALADLGPSFTALDLACGPGSMSERLLTRFPEARAVAVDVDPVMLAIGRGALGTVGGRLQWVEADLASPRWLDALDDTPVQAVLSTTALHWVEPEALTRLYRDVAHLLPLGGRFLNGDNMGFSSDLPTFAHLAERVQRETWSDAAFAARNIETAEQWWDAFALEPGVEPLLAERTRRFAGKQQQESPPGLDFHRAALCSAGFREVGTIWQVLTDRVLLAVR